MAMLAGCTFTMILAIVLKAGRQTHLECVAELKLQLFDWGLPETNVRRIFGPQEGPSQIFCFAYVLHIFPLFCILFAYVLHKYAKICKTYAKNTQQICNFVYFVAYFLYIFCIFFKQYAKQYANNMQHICKNIFNIPQDLSQAKILLRLMILLPDVIRIYTIY